MKETILSLIWGLSVLTGLMIIMFIWQSHYCSQLQKEYPQEQIRSAWGGCKIYKQGKWIMLNSSSNLSK